MGVVLLKRKLTSFQIIILGFSGVILFGTFLLMLPFSSRSGLATPFSDALFTSTSAVCVTGLIIHDTATYWSGFGQFVILLLIQIGGMGVITVAASFAMISGRKISLMQRSTMQEAISAPKVGGIVRLTGFIVRVTLVMELLCAAVMAPVFCRDFGKIGLWMALFHSVLVTAVITTNRLCGILTSVVSVLVFNFFFTTPRLTFHFDDPNYIITFTIMFIVTLLSGSLATRLKENAKQSAHTAYRTKILFETNQLLQKEQDENAVITATAGQLMKLLKKDIVVYLSDGKELATPNVFRAVNSIQEDLISENEKAVADWAFRNNKHAGATTDTLSSAKCLYLAIRVNQNVYGVAGIAVNGTPLDSFENSVLLSILGECALALENIKNAKEKEEAAVLAQNEQLRANLLRAISHDLRTPLTAISGSADNLLANYKKMDDALREQTFTDIYDDSMWLINLVENLLAVTRIEGGQVNLTWSIELMDEVVSEALKHINRKSKEHTIRVTSGKDFILAHIDAKLIVQVIINLVDNAIKYTPVGSVIEIHTDQKEQWVTVSVSDNGPGIPDEQKPRIFDMFYSGANKVVDSRRSLGLGLSLCKSIVTAHGGTISVSDNQPNGTVFKFTLPAEEVELHE